MHRNDPKLNFENMKGTLHIKFLGLRVSNFHPFRPTVSRFQDIARCMVFLLTSMLKLQSAITF